MNIAATVGRYGGRDQIDWINYCHLAAGLASELGSARLHFIPVAVRGAKCGGPHEAPLKAKRINLPAVGLIQYRANICATGAAGQRLGANYAPASFIISKLPLGRPAWI